MIDQIQYAYIHKTHCFFCFPPKFLHVSEKACPGFLVQDHPCTSMYFMFPQGSAPKLGGLIHQFKIQQLGFK